MSLININGEYTIDRKINQSPRLFVPQRTNVFVHFVLSLDTTCLDYISLLRICVWAVIYK